MVTRNTVSALSAIFYNAKSGADARVTYRKPTQDVDGTCLNTMKNAGGVVRGDYWSFYYGANVPISPTPCTGSNNPDSTGG